MSKITKDELISKLSILKEGPGYSIVMFDTMDQIALEDEPGVMILDLTKEQLIENAELDPKTVTLLRNNADIIRSWIIKQGFSVEFNI